MDPRASARNGARGSWLRRSGLEPVGRLVAWALVAAWLGFWGALADSRLRGPERAARRLRRSEENVRRLVAQLGALKGLYAKAGQFASVRLDLLTGETRRALESLQQSVAPIPVAAIRRIIESELGEPVESRFTSFDARPLGSASIGQVHCATLPDATKVAVKVQYPWVASSLRADLRIARTALVLLCWTTGRRIPDRKRLFEEFAASYASELDFESEAHSAREIAGNLSGESGVLVPRVFDEHSTRRVLTTSYIPTLPLDRQALLNRGIVPTAVLEIVARAYAKQVFVDGIFHADPHPGNLFVLDAEESVHSPKVVFVDFGLSKRLDPALREAMRQGLFALIQRDADAFVRHMDTMKMIAPGAHAGVRGAVDAMFERIRQAQEENRPEHALGVAGAQIVGLQDEAKKLLQDTPGLQLPNDLLLYAKTLSYLFSLGERLAPEVDLVKISLPYLLRFLAGRA